VDGLLLDVGGPKGGKERGEERGDIGADVFTNPWQCMSQTLGRGLFFCHSGCAIVCVSPRMFMLCGVFIDRYSFGLVATLGDQWFYERNREYAVNEMAGTNHGERKKQLVDQVLLDLVNVNQKYSLIAG